MGPKGTRHNLVLARCSQSIKNPARVYKRGPLGPQSTSRRVSRCVLGIYTYVDIASSKYYVHMYIKEKAQKIYTKTHMYNITQTWDGPCPPPIYFWGAALFTIFTWLVSGAGCPT